MLDSRVVSHPQAMIVEALGFFRDFVLVGSSRLLEVKDGGTKVNDLIWEQRDDRPWRTELGLGSECGFGQRHKPCTQHAPRIHQEGWWE